MIALQTKGLSKKYDDKFALKSLDLNIEKGEVYGFIGRNGAGKTTTINLMLSLIHPTEGDIYVNEKLVEFENQNYKKIIGYVPDVPAYPKYMNALEYLIYTCDMYELENKKEKALELLEFVNLKDLNKKLGAYSRGMMQRLAIAQALVHDPEIIIMDEPTSALDPLGRKDVMNIIQKLKGSKTIFYSTHILEDVEKVCDRIGLLENGQLILEDSIDNIREKYFNSKMFIETDKEAKELFAILSEMNLKNNIELKNKGIVCDVKGETSAQDILEILLQQKIKIIEFRRLNATLEDVFIKVTHEETT